MMNGGESPHDRLRRLVVERRRHLTLSVSAAAKLAKINRATWAALERGDRQTEDYIYGGVERALAWAPGSIDAILRGESPVISEQATPEPTWAEKLERVKQIADNPDRSAGLRAWAARQVDDIEAILAAARAEEEAQRRNAS